MSTNLELFNDLLGCLKYLIEATVINLESKKSKTCQSTQLINNSNKSEKGVDLARIVHTLSQESQLNSFEISQHITSILNLDFTATSFENSTHDDKQLTTIFKINFVDLIYLYFRVQQYYFECKFADSYAEVHSHSQSLSNEKINTESYTSQVILNQNCRKNDVVELTQANMNYLSFNLIDPTQVCLTQLVVINVTV